MASFACSFANLTFSMFCCVDEVFQSLPQPINNRNMVFQMNACFNECNVSSRMELLNEAILHILEDDSTQFGYKSSECGPVHKQCSEDVEPFYLAYMIFLTVILLAALLGNLVVTLTIAYSGSLQKLYNSY